MLQSKTRTNLGHLSTGSRMSQAQGMTLTRAELQLDNVFEARPWDLMEKEVNMTNLALTLEYMKTYST